MNDNSNSFSNRRKQSTIWSFLNPEERATLTAGQLNAQNQKVRKSLQVITKGLEDEKRCETVARAKEQIQLQNRLSRLSRASEHMARRSMASMTSVEATGNYLAKSTSGREIMKKASEALNRKSIREAEAKLQQWYSEAETARRGSSSFFPDSVGFHDGERRKVRFDAEKFIEEDVENKNKTLQSKDSVLLQSGFNSPRSVISSYVNLSSRQQRGSIDSSFYEDDRNLRGVKPPSCLDYYAAPLLSRITMQPCRGFSHNAASFQSYSKERNSLNQSSGLSNEMMRWRRLSTTRATNARLKAIRPLSRRHTTQSLHEAMDENARIRKEHAIRPQDFTPHVAWQMLNCRYLRLTQNNIKMLEQVCGDAGYDVSTHPHSTLNLETDLKLGNEKETMGQELSSNEDETFLVA